MTRMINDNEKRQLELFKKARQDFDQLAEDNDKHCDMVEFQYFLEYYEVKNAS